MHESMINTQLMQLGVGLGVLLIWWIYYRTLVRPWTTSNRQEGKPFPFVGFLVALGLTFGAILYVTNDLAYKQESLGRSNSVKVTQPTTEREVLENQAPSEPAETLEQKEQRMVDKNRQENEEAKKTFSELPNVSSEKPNGN
jgi:hypothetical protein